MEDFKIVNTKEALGKMGVSIPEWRHNFVYNKVGSLYFCGGDMM